jgi:hypothetical protein
MSRFYKKANNLLLLAFLYKRQNKKYNLPYPRIRLLTEQLVFNAYIIFNPNY